MNKRELNLSNKKLYEGTSEDIVLKSPMRIPRKEIQDLIALRNLNTSPYAYYDLSKTDTHAITFRFVPPTVGYNDLGDEVNFIGFSDEESHMFMGDFNGV